MKKYRCRGRLVLEAAVLTPFICLLLVYLFFFTLYAHDCAVCVHTALEGGTRGAYQDQSSDTAIRMTVQEAIEKKLAERLLWMQDATVEVQVNPVRVKVCISGTGNFLPVEGIEVCQEIVRISACETVRRSRWLLD